MLLVFLFIAIGVILFSIIKLKINASISLIIGALVMGVLSNIGLLKTATVITAGFGGLMTGIGLSIGFGIILGQLLSDFGGAKTIADSMVAVTSEKYSLYALGFTALILSIPVFFDVVFVILIPLALGISERIKKPKPYAIGAMAIGAMTGHTFIPPTPNPMAAAEILNFDLGIMVLVGLIGGIIATFIGCFILFKLLDRGFWNTEKDELSTLTISKTDVSNEIVNTTLRVPPFGLALLPILFPVVMILLKTVLSSFGKSNLIVNFLGDKTMALLVGVLISYLIAKYCGMTANAIEQSVSKALAGAGMVLLVTGAGGSFGAVISETGIADYIASGLSNLSGAPVISILISALLGFVFRLALGSGTVASITAMTIMSGIAPTIGVHPVFIALACLSGSISIGHVNDSGYWVVTNMGGFTVSGGLKIYTLGGFFIGVVGIIISILGAFLF